MLAIRTGETITDGSKTYVLGRDNKFHLLPATQRIDRATLHHVPSDLLKAIVGE